MIAVALMLFAPMAAAYAAEGPSRATIDDPGEVLSGKVTLRGTATASEGYEIDHVRIVIDGVAHGNAHGRSTWTYALDTRKLTDGPHQITAIALAKPEGGSSVVTTGRGASLHVEVLNGVGALILYDQTLVFTGWQPVSWVHRLDQDVAGLRLLLEAEEGVLGTAVLSYSNHVEDGVGHDGSAHVIAEVALSDAILHGPAGIDVNPAAPLREAGLLILQGQFAGGGALRLRVEAVALTEE